MGFIGLFYPWGLILQALAIVHFIRRRPENFWLWIILIGGGLGALVYIAAEVVPDAGLLRASLTGLSRRRRIRELEAIILDNPSVGNLEELAEFYWTKASSREHASSSTRSSRRDPTRCIPYIDVALPRRRWKTSPQRCLTWSGWLHAIRSTISTARLECSRMRWAERDIPSGPRRCSRPQPGSPRSRRRPYNYASFLAAQRRPSEAREWAQRILAKKPTMPGYLRRRERPWFRKAKALLKQLPAK